MTQDKQEKQKTLMSMYRETRPREFVGEKSTTNHLAWSLLIVLMALAFWLALALAAAENQRYALQTKACQDHVFPTEIDMACLQQVKSREHWWQHVGHALVHMGT
ncbi:hypothetical protein [Janthinobacterium psychrotolerans]|uniref:Uncharacterized protein n=1 Tax=Janthinobacterium psychrotolerans TaxID=1747903 RepID=A0A1A7C0C8_9BURK|nr:hypothetical protein [Janthinobacterium psychrotolerans]OBV39197.1 hypothetical protein ASR47_100911 [Janthinobacterium psychrotolerans]